MKRFLRTRFILVAVLTVALISQVCYAVPEDDIMALPYAEPVPVANTEAVKTEPTVTTGIVSTGVLNVRANPGTDQSLVGKLYTNSKVKINKTDNGWYQITTEGVNGWVSADYVSNVVTVTEKAYSEEISRGMVKRTDPPVAVAKAPVSKANSVVALVKKQVGKPYVYGATGPNAFDCSGLMSYVFKANGISVPRSSKSYLSFGTTVSKANLQPGDVILLDTNGAVNGVVSHVGMYVGNRQMVHASTGGRGVVYDNIDSKYYAQRYIKSVRVL